MFGQQRKNVSHQPFEGHTLRRALDAYEMRLGGGLERYHQRGWMVPPQQQEWREALMDDAESLGAPGLPPEFGLPPAQVGARVSTQGGGKSVYGAGSPRPPRRDTPVLWPNRVSKSFEGDVFERHGRRAPGTGTRPGPHRRNAPKLPRKFERFISKKMARGWPEEAMQYYLQELTEQDEPKPSDLNALEQILRDDTITLEKGEPRKTWTPMKFLGKGGYGDVVLWRRRRDDGTVDQMAVKNTRFDQFFIDYSSEAHLTRRLNVAGCTNVIQVYDWAALEQERRVRIIYAFYPLGDLMRTLRFYQKQRLIFPEVFIWHIFYNIATALCFCARGSVGPNPREGWEEIVHCDLKPPNILMEYPDPAVNPFYPNLRLADFGLAYTVPNETIRDFKRRYGTGGTPGFTAPEMRRELRGDPKVTFPFPGSHSDVHSLGDTLRMFMQCATHRYPSYARRLLREAVDDEWGWEYWPYSEELASLVERCRAPDGRDRPSAYELYLITKQRSESMLEAQMALEERAQAGNSVRGLHSATVLYTQESQEEYRKSDRFRDSYAKNTDWAHRHAADFKDLCDAARNPRPAPAGYVAVGNGLRFALIDDYPNTEDRRRRLERGLRASHISLPDQQVQAPPAHIQAAGAALQGARQPRGFSGRVRNFFSRMRRTGR